MQTEIIIQLKDGVLDPQGKAISNALHALGYRGIHSVKVGKIIQLELDNSIKKEEVEQMCETLLANTVIEDYSICFK